MTETTPLADAGNTLLAETQAQLSTGLADTPTGQRLVMTIRTPTTTLTVLLNGTDAKTWADQLGKEAGRMSGSGLVAASGRLAGP